MSDNVEVFTGAHREYADDRDWLVPNEGRPYTSNVVSFSPRLLTCGICGARTHRPTQCPSRPRNVRPSAND